MNYQRKHFIFKLMEPQYFFDAENNDIFWFVYTFMTTGPWCFTVGGLRPSWPWTCFINKATPPTNPTPTKPTDTQWLSQGHLLHGWTQWKSLEVERFGVYIIQSMKTRSFF